MAVQPSEFKTYRTTGNATGSDKASAQNDPNGSLGGWFSTTEHPTGINNLFSEWTQAQKSASTRYRCLGIHHTNLTDLLNSARLLAQNINTYPAECVISVGVQTNDNLTVAPVCADENTAPAGITFVSLTEVTGVAGTDFPLAYPIGPRNSAGDGVTDLNISDDDRIFVYFRIVCTALTDTLDGLSFTTPLLGDAV
jgi:hypothetical protein